MNRVLCAAAVLLIAGCCGYSTRSLLPPHIRTVAVLPAENSTTQPGLGDELTDALIAAFKRDRSLRVTTLESADLVLTLNVSGYSRNASAYDEEQAVSAYEISVTAQVDAEDQVRGESFFSSAVSARLTYNPEGKTEEAAATEALAKLADEIVRRVITAW